MMGRLRWTCWILAAIRLYRGWGRDGYATDTRRIRNGYATDTQRIRDGYATDTRRIRDGYATLQEYRNLVLGQTHVEYHYNAYE
jgi:hypothetical protein